MANGQEVNLKVNVGQSASDMNSAATAAENLENKLQNAAEGVQAVSAAATQLGTSASAADGNLADLAKTINAFLLERGKLAGKSPKLLDVAQDQKSLVELKQQFQELLNLTNRPGGIGATVAMANGKNNRPEVPSQVNVAAIASSPKEQAQFMVKMVERLLTHHLKASNAPIQTGLTATELTGRHMAEPSPQPHQPGPAHPGEEPKNEPEKGIQRAGRMLAGKAIAGAGLGGVGEVASGAAQGAAGLLPGGILGGAGIAAVGYGLYKAASALSEGVDQNKVESTDLDKFKRSLGATADSFDALRSSSRLIGDMFHLTYEQSRKLTLEFANIAKTNVGAVPQAMEGVRLAQSVGVDESQGVGMMADLRRDGALGPKKEEARLFAVQFAEALKRSGSTLNASDLMQSIRSFSGETSHRSLTAPNLEGFVGMLTAMVGSNTPGLNVGNSAAILNRADSAFQSGGHMGEASNTLQFAALGGGSVGLLGVKARQAAGMFSTADQAFGTESSQLNKYMRGQGAQDFTRFGGQETGIESVMRMFDANNTSAEGKLLGLGNHFGLNPEQAATLYNLRDSGRLTSTVDLANKYKGDVDLQKMSGAGYTTLAEIAGNNKGLAGLEEIRSGLANRSDLTKDQKSQLASMRGESDQEKLKESLVKFSATLERERTQGEEIMKNSADTAKALNRMADPLVKISTESRGFLAAIADKLAPDSQAAKDERARLDAIKSAENKAERDSRRDRVDAGTATPADKRDVNGEYVARIRNEPFDSPKKLELAREQYARLGKLASMPKGIEDSFMPGTLEKMRKEVDAEKARKTYAGSDPRLLGSVQGGGKLSPDLLEQAAAVDAELAKINPQWKPGTTISQLQVESGLNPKAVSPVGARGIAQVMPATQKTWESRTGRNFDPFDASDGIEMFRLQMGENLRSKKTVEDAQRAYNAGPDERRWNNKETREYAGKIAAVKLPPGNPQAKAEAQAEAQRFAFNFSPLRFTSDINVNTGSGQDWQTQTITNSGVVRKPTAVGALQ